MGKRVAVAMSGGVDSSVTAALLKAKGYDVLGLTMHLFSRKGETSRDSFSSAQAIKDARQVANTLAIPFYVLDLQWIFEKKVISYFCQEYREAKTPNPCIICNQEIKFKALWEKAKELKVDYLATGHYARIIHNYKGRHLIKRALDQEKDQSYTLYHLTQEQLGRTLMPLGDYHKDEVREIAYHWNLLVYDQKESQEICFVPNNDYRAFLLERDPSFQREGPILNKEGKRLGTHQGLAFYTIGQRRGLGISTPTPKYVIELDPNSNSLLVGDENEVYDQGLIASNLNLVALQDLSYPLEVMAQIRYNTKPKKALVEKIEADKVKVTFTTKERAITPGQVVVFYDGELLLGGGVIKERVN